MGSGLRTSLREKKRETEKTRLDQLVSADCCVVNRLVCQAAVRAGRGREGEAVPSELNI